MKSVITFAFSPLFAAVILFCGCSRQKPGDASAPEAPAERTYQPLVGTNAFAIMFTDSAKSFADPVAQAFQSLAERKGREFNEALAAETGEKMSASLAKYNAMSQADSMRHFFGLEPEDMKWCLAAFEKFDPTLFLGDSFPTNAVLPHVYEVFYAARPFDLDKTAQAVRDLFKDMCGADAEFSNSWAQASEKMSKVFAVERGEHAGAVAYRFTVTNPETGEKIAGASPIVTTLGGGKLLVLAASEKTLAHVKALYDGEEPAAAADSAVVRELNLPANVHARFVVTGIDELVSALEQAATDSGDVPAGIFGDDSLGDVRLFRFDVGVDAAQTNLFLRAAVEFAKEETAAELAKEAQEGISSAMPLAQMMFAMQPELAFVGQILQTLQVASSGPTVAAGLGLPYAVLEGVDCQKLAQKAAEVKKQASGLPFGLPGSGSGGESVEDDVFDE